MEWFEAVILGLVQGLTEFLPVSSSGHLEIGKVLLGVETTDDLLFTTMVHAATVLSTIVVFRKQIWDLLKGFFKFSDNDQMDYVLKIAVSMIPVLIVGLFFKDSVEAMFGSIHVVGVALVMTALLLFFSDRASRPGMKSIFPEKEYRNGISYWQAFAVGLGQAFAVIPGLSRSGTTISTGLICGVKEHLSVHRFKIQNIPERNKIGLVADGARYGVIRQRDRRDHFPDLARKLAAGDHHLGFGDFRIVVYCDLHSIASF
jgi:undecaprenyl-diphosphatase